MIAYLFNIKVRLCDGWIGALCDVCANAAEAHHGGRGADGDGEEEREETKHLGWSEYEKALNSN